ncbi:carbohydrate ABC transporter permease [Jiangella aurantiaca]|nr:sugar ABC transporter permease [Jiangella aurantiaca]
MTTTSTAPPARAVPRRQRRHGSIRARERRLGIMFALPATLLFLAVLAYPIFENIRTTFFSVDLLTGRTEYVGLANLRELAGDETLRSTVGRTLLWTVACLAGQLGLGLLAALLIDQPWKGMRWIRQLLLLPYVVPVIASALIWTWMLDGSYGILGSGLQSLGVVPDGTSPLGMESASLWTVIVINVWRGFPFAMLVFWASLQGIDQQQYEAAKVDGAGPLREFWSITLPNLRGAVIALVALRGIWTLMYFELIWLTTRGGPVNSSDIIPTYIYKIVMGEFRLGYAAAVATVTGLTLFALAAVVVVVRKLRRAA